MAGPEGVQVQPVPDGGGEVGCLPRHYAAVSITKVVGSDGWVGGYLIFSTGW